MPALVALVTALTATDAPSPRAGTWAYYAERYAEGHGCNLGGPGGQCWTGSASGAELHRVHCAEGRQILVRCIGGVCTGAR